MNPVVPNENYKGGNMVVHLTQNDSKLSTDFPLGYVKQEDLNIKLEKGFSAISYAFTKALEKFKDAKLYDSSFVLEVYWSDIPFLKTQPFVCNGKNFGKVFDEVTTLILNSLDKIQRQIPTGKDVRYLKSDQYLRDEDE